MEPEDLAFSETEIGPLGDKNSWAFLRDAQEKDLPAYKNSAWPERYRALYALYEREVFDLHEEVKKLEEEILGCGSSFHERK